MRDTDDTIQTGGQAHEDTMLASVEAGLMPGSEAVQLDTPDDVVDLRLQLVLRDEHAQRRLTCHERRAIDQDHEAHDRVREEGGVLVPGGVEGLDREDPPVGDHVPLPGVQHRDEQAQLERSYAPRVAFAVGEQGRHHHEQHDAGEVRRLVLAQDVVAHHADGRVCIEQPDDQEAGQLLTPEHDPPGQGHEQRRRADGHRAVEGGQVRRHAGEVDPSSPQGDCEHDRGLCDQEPAGPPTLDAQGPLLEAADRLSARSYYRVGTGHPLQAKQDGRQSARRPGVEMGSRRTEVRSAGCGGASGGVDDETWTRILP